MKKQKAPVEPVVHLDKLGKTVEVGSVVAFPAYNTLEIGVVEKATAKMVHIQKLPRDKWRNIYKKYSHDIVIVNDADVTLYVLKNS